ncbi:MAG: glycosyltransferase family 2 protein [Actinomycetaceae bacterium]|nr:glycosyltransferase family 2 protein [Actinomycetaceae bacterium]
MSTDIPTSAKEAVCLVVPVYNEATVLAQVLHMARAHFPMIVCVNDGSSDNSGDEVRKSGVILVEHAVNLGQGAALQTGIEYALKHTQARYIATFDSDGQHEITDIEKMYALAEEKNLAVVFGSRFLEGKSEAGALKRLVLRFAAWFTARSTGMKVTDAHNGVRLLRRDAASMIHLKQNRMAHASEIVAQIGKTGLPWEEIPVTIAYTDYSKSKGQSLWNSVNILYDLIMG